MLKINPTTLYEVSNSLEKFHTVLNRIHLTSPVGNWSPKVQTAVDVYLASINSQLQNNFFPTALKQSQEIENFIDEIQLYDEIQL